MDSGRESATLCDLCEHTSRNRGGGDPLGLTPELVVVGAALCLSTAVAHLTAVLFIVHPKTELLPLETHTHTEANKANV